MHRFIVNIEDDQWEWLRKRAFNLDISISQVIRNGIIASMGAEKMMYGFDPDTLNELKQRNS